MQFHHLNLFLLSSMVVLLHGLSNVDLGLHPVVLVPGSGGNQLEARLTKDYKPSSLLCSSWARGDTRGGKWFRMWFDTTVLVPPLIKCFAERMTLHFDEEIDDYRNAPGVKTRVPYFGSTQGLLYLDPYLKHISEYMASLVQTLEDMGYEDSKNLFGAPYDWRYGLAAAGHSCKVGTQYLSDLKALIEKAFISNNNKSVIILSHSLGGLFALNLLNGNSLAWQKKYIKHFIALSAPWGGTVQEMLTFASGYTLGIPLVNPLAVRSEQRSSESNMWLLPSPTTFGNQVLVQAQSTNYTSKDMSQFLNDIGFPQGVKLYNTRVLPLVTSQLARPPSVDVTCVVGSGVETPERLLYKSEFDRQPEVVYGDGDGTVNMRSLVALERQWRGVKERRLKIVKVDKVSHTDLLKDVGALEVIKGEICEINNRDAFRSVGISSGGGSKDN